MGKSLLGSLLDNRATKMGRSMLGISKADSAYKYQKANGNSRAMRQEIGRKGGFTASYNSTQKKGR